MSKKNIDSKDKRKKKSLQYNFDMIYVKACPKNPKEIIKYGVTHKSPLVMMYIVKLVVNQLSLNVKTAKS